MHTHMLIKSWFTKLAAALLAGITIAGLALAPVAAAAPTTDTLPPVAVTPGAVTPTLEKVYEREQLWLSVQTLTLTNANSIATNAQDWINTLKDQGKDVAALETALADFNAQVASAQTSHDAAAATLAAHAGFDANGAVTDRAQAAATLRQGHQSLQTAHLTLVSAAANLRLAVRTWRLAH
jgi:hypothetical protein